MRTLGVIRTAVLDVKSPRWSELEHAYGTARDTPSRLCQLLDLPKSEGTTEPWLALWSSLAHQDDVYAAPIAAVPHVVAVLTTAPDRADESCLQFPAWVEICRTAVAGAVLEMSTPEAAMEFLEWSMDQ